MLKNIKIFLFLLIILTLLKSCQTKKYIKVEKPDSSQVKNLKIAHKESFISIPIQIKTTEIEKLINSKIKGLIYQDNNFEDNNNDNLMIKVWKYEDISISASQNKINYRVPLKLWIKTGFKVNNFGIKVSQYKEIEGTIALYFQTIIAIENNWQVKSNTIVNGYEWIQSPVTKILGVNIPITYIANIIIKRNSDFITKQIDHQIYSLANIKPFINITWNEIQKPTLISDSLKLWMQIIPEEVLFNQIKSINDSLNIWVGMKCFVKTYFAIEPIPTALKELPNLKIISNPENRLSISLFLK